MSAGMPRPLSRTVTVLSALSVTQISVAYPASTSSMELSTISNSRWCRPAEPVSPMYMAGRVRTCSTPSSRRIVSAVYSSVTWPIASASSTPSLTYLRHHLPPGRVQQRRRPVLPVDVPVRRCSTPSPSSATGSARSVSLSSSDPCLVFLPLPIRFSYTSAVSSLLSASSSYLLKICSNYSTFREMQVKRKACKTSGHMWE